MAEVRRIYQAIDPVTNDDAESAFSRNDPDELLLVVIGVGMYSDDLRWSEDFCLRLADHQHFNVRGNAILSFGHLARRFGTLQKPKSIDAIRRGLTDSDDYVRGQAESAADDVEWFARLKVRRPSLPYNHPLQRTGAAGMFSWIRKWFGCGPGH